jgi:membrane protease YdiL (CAAX protease family)
VVIGLFTGFLLSSLAFYIYDRNAPTINPSVLNLNQEIALFLGLWIGFLIPVLALKIRNKGANLHDLIGLKIKPLFDIPLGVLAGVVSQFIFGYLIYLPFTIGNSRLKTELSKPEHELLAMAHGGQWITLFFLIGFCAPIFEEIFFRGISLRAFTKLGDSFLKKYSKVFAAISSALLFAVVHGEPLQAPGLFLFGLLLAAFALKTNRLGIGIVSHMAFNLTALVLYILK